MSSGKLTLGSMGATNISSFGAMSMTIGGSSEEVISNIDVALGNTNATADANMNTNSNTNANANANANTNHAKIDGECDYEYKYD